MKCTFTPFRFPPWRKCWAYRFHFEVRKALEQAGRQDLIGSGCDALIPAQPPKEALQARMERANRAFRGDYVHTIPQSDRLAATRSGARPAKNRGYRPGRKTAQRRSRMMKKWN